jgi:hypothetical protein
MRKTIVLFISFISLLQLTAQNTSPFDKFEDYDEVTAVVVNKKAFSMLRKIAEDNEENAEFREMVGGLEMLKVFTTEDKATAIEMRETFNAYLKKGKLEELMRVKDEGQMVKIFVREGKDEDHVSEFLMMVDGLNKNNGEEPEFVIISIIGDIDLNNISKLTSQMNLPAGDQIKKVERKR